MQCSAANAGWFLSRGGCSATTGRNQPFEVNHGSLVMCRDNESCLWQKFWPFWDLDARQDIFILHLADCCFTFGNCNNYSCRYTLMPIQQTASCLFWTWWSGCVAEWGRRWRTSLPVPILDIPCNDIELKTATKSGTFSLHLSPGQNRNLFVSSQFSHSILW